MENKLEERQAQSKARWRGKLLREKIPPPVPPPEVEIVSPPEVVVVVPPPAKTFVGTINTPRSYSHLIKREKYYSPGDRIRIIRNWKNYYGENFTNYFIQVAPGLNLYND